METYKLKEGHSDMPYVKDEVEIEVFSTEPIQTITLKRLNEKLEMLILEMGNLQERKIVIEGKIVEIGKLLDDGLKSVGK